MILVDLVERGIELLFRKNEVLLRPVKSGIFLDSNKKPIKFFDAAIGGASGGVPGTLHALYNFHRDY